MSSPARRSGWPARSTTSSGRAGSMPARCTSRSCRATRCGSRGCRRGASSRTSRAATSSCSTRPPTCRDVVGDPDKIGRVLINLVDNAIKYSPDGGRVEVKLARVGGGRVRFAVTDQGLGDAAGRAAADLREVLPPRPEHDPGRGRHRARPLHLPGARAPHGRPDLGRVRRPRPGLDVQPRAAGRARRTREGGLAAALSDAFVRCLA